MMISIDSIKSAKFVSDPFRYSVVTNLLSKETIAKLLRCVPLTNYFRSERYSGSDKTYNVVNNLLLKLGEKEYNLESNLHQNWISLVQDLTSSDYIDALSILLGVDLSTCSQEITLKRYGYGDFISAHTDTENVTATHMIFLNQRWQEDWGGHFCFLHDEQQIFLKIKPVSENSVAFVRAENSWHSVEKIMHSNAERLAIQVAFWNVTQRYVLPGRIEESVDGNLLERPIRL